MRDILNPIQKWRAEDKQIALATVVMALGSTPRREGARLVVTSTGEMAGSVSGGCVENDVINQAQEVLETGKPRLIRYAITDDMVWDVGLACGGTIEVWVEKLENTKDPLTTAATIQHELERAVVTDRMIAQAVLLNGPGRPGARLLVWPTGDLFSSLGDPELDHQVAKDALALMSHPRAESRQYAEPEARVFLEILPPPYHIVIFGAVHIAIPLTSMAKTLGYRVTIVDPRTKFANRDRFPTADQIIPQWPQRAVEHLEIGPSTACVILTHDPKIDEPALKSLLATSAGYIGVIGSRNTHAERVERMAKLGVKAEQLEKVHAPIGLDLGARTPEEIALAILAEIVALRRGGPAGFLRDKR